jgi:6-phosphogluconolactonase
MKDGERVRRLTLTMKVLAAAREVVVLVAGARKADALAAVLERDAPVPARDLNEQAERVLWMVDRSAAGRLQSAVPSGGGS